jgi:hypothetical protein
VSLWAEVEGGVNDRAHVAKYYPEDRDLLLEFEPKVIDYEVVGQSLDGW